jgi:hypothetical protein
MWSIQIIDGRPGIIYIREYLLDGRILVFYNEEVALRFMLRIAKHLSEILGVKLQTIRFASDPRREKSRDVSESRMNDYIQMFLNMH